MLPVATRLCQRGLAGWGEWRGGGAPHSTPPPHHPPHYVKIQCRSSSQPALPPPLPATPRAGSSPAALSGCAPLAKSSNLLLTGAAPGMKMLPTPLANRSAPLSGSSQTVFRCPARGSWHHRARARVGVAALAEPARPPRGTHRRQARAGRAALRPAAAAAGNLHHHAARATAGAPPSQRGFPDRPAPWVASLLVGVPRRFRSRHEGWGLRGRPPPPALLPSFHPSS